MHRISWFVAGFVLGIAALLTVQKYHIVRADDGLHFVSRVSAGYDDIYVDIREFGVTDWDRHQSVAMAIMRSHKPALLKGSATRSVQQAIDHFFAPRER